MVVELNREAKRVMGWWVVVWKGCCRRRHLHRSCRRGQLGHKGAAGSSGISEFENQPVQGVKKCTEASSPAGMQSLSDQIEQKSTVNPGTTGEKSGKSSGVANENPSDKLTVADKESKEVMRNVMVDMPCVSTKGDGPNGKRIEGFLYRYRKGEEVRIVCVCHGSFLSPAEFVKHAGGGDVEQPLKRIVVSPSSLL
ncbi:hypothetical protein L1049_002959 [Liquidambar formosana]|uniref:Ninja-family protein n=1 Tax=Liquidambar formosana TaxID=63359 RepID=A0AAP0NJ52_LIQFO